MLGSARVHGNPTLECNYYLGADSLIGKNDARTLGAVYTCPRVWVINGMSIRVWVACPTFST
jgi:hypothetical protein